MNVRFHNRTSCVYMLWFLCNEKTAINYILRTFADCLQFENIFNAIV